MGIVWSRCVVWIRRCCRKKVKSESGSTARLIKSSRHEDETKRSGDVDVEAGFGGGEEDADGDEEEEDWGSWEDTPPVKSKSTVARVSRPTLTEKKIVRRRKKNDYNDYFKDMEVDYKKPKTKFVAKEITVGGLKNSRFAADKSAVRPDMNTAYHVFCSYSLTTSLFPTSLYRKMRFRDGTSTPYRTSRGGPKMVCSTTREVLALDDPPFIKKII